MIIILAFIVITRVWGQSWQRIVLLGFNILC